MGQSLYNPKKHSHCGCPNITRVCDIKPLAPVDPEGRHMEVRSRVAWLFYSTRTRKKPLPPEAGMKMVTSVKESRSRRFTEALERSIGSHVFRSVERSTM